MKNIKILSFTICAVFILNFSCTKEKTNTNVSKLTYGSLTDQDGNGYRTITIGAQTWMAENLRTTKYRNGDLIGTTTPATLNISTDSTAAYQWPAEGKESSAALYGRLYTWYAVTDSRNVCPDGWHVPSGSEWMTLTDYLIFSGYCYGQDVDQEVAKSMANTSGWPIDTKAGNVGNDQANNNKSGFTALPSGIRDYYDGNFYSAGSECVWWSTTSEPGWDGPVCRGLMYNFSQLLYFSTPYYGQAGYSVRCLKD
jgi:uncharacterized protein (TIGR02145 family)